MSNTNPRHGTPTGYRQGCREACCRRAVADYALRYRNRRYLERADSLMVPMLGTHRRIQALVALGWSLSELSRRAGFDRSMLPQMLRRTTPIRQATARHIARLYDELSMQLPPRDTKTERVAATKALKLAKSQGWLPPLAWDDETIDDPLVKPRKTHVVAKKDIDPVVVERVLAGDYYLHTTRAEKDEIVRRWKAMGRSERSLCEATGWKDGRYGKAAEVADAC